MINEGNEEEEGINILKEKKGKLGMKKKMTMWKPMKEWRRNEANDK